jgi:hypothetical protein
MRPSLLLASTALALSAALPSHAATMNWADWETASVAAQGNATGSFSTLGGLVGIQFAGQLAFAQLGTGTNYFTQGDPPPYTSSLVDNAPAAAEMLALSQAGTRSLQFSAPVDNLFFAVVSLNGNGFRFDSDFEIVSFGQGYWGSGTLTRVDPGNGQFQLNGASGEPHGVIRFTGSVSSITWQSLNNENWYGFTVGTYGLAPPPVPEPASLMLLLAGLACVGVAVRRRQPG